MMRFTGLGVGHLEHKARTIHRLIVEDEPNWAELCPVAATTGTDLADIESDSGSGSDGMVSLEDLDNNTF